MPCPLIVVVKHRGHCSTHFPKCNWNQKWLLLTVQAAGIRSSGCRAPTASLKRSNSKVEQSLSHQVSMTWCSELRGPAGSVLKLHILCDYWVTVHSVQLYKLSPVSTPTQVPATICVWGSSTQAPATICVWGSSSRVHIFHNHTILESSIERVFHAQLVLAAVKNIFNILLRMLEEAIQAHSSAHAEIEGFVTEQLLQMDAKERRSVDGARENLSFLIKAFNIQ